ncbi:lymphocyte antigen 6H [Archocentrus centrarchus]|uniref:lymphocyte antigen 6H n=1 Tax=Archocentrus centrarchus TaxID=63155 RepID=UPI0011E9CBC4|nr:lymphocyte antigen 6H [Archocentrus centrarchus]
MPHSQLLIILTCCLPLAACLCCYTCLFPSISPLDCSLPVECPAGQHCLSSVASGRKGELQLTLYEKSCAIASQCNVSGQKYASDTSFNYTNVCCETDLCNGAVSIATLSWAGQLLCLLPALSLLLA